MADYVLTLGTFAILIALALLAWRAAAGRPRSAARACGRFALAATLALPAVGAAVYLTSRSRTFQLAGEVVLRVETAEKVVALTFDDGPTPGYTEEVLGILAAREVRATFYLTGRECEENPLQLRAIVQAGHELGNHTFSHRRMWFLPAAAVAEEIERTDAAFRTAGFAGRATFRPPGCKRLLAAPLYLASGGRATVTWDLEPDSIKGVAGDADAIVEHVVDGVRPGSIVLMHVMYDPREASRNALPRVIDELAAEGYRFVTVSELLALRGR